jgi:hypothetical protein
MIAINKNWISIEEAREMLLVKSIGRVNENFEEIRTATRLSSAKSPALRKCRMTISA